MSDAFRRRTLGERRRLQVGQSGRGDAADLPQIVGDAGGVRAVDHRLTGRHAIDVLHDQRAGDARVEEVVVRAGLQDGRAVLQVAVVRPGRVQLTAQAGHDPVGGVTEVRLTSAAFHVTTTDVQRDVGRSAGVRAADRRQFRGVEQRVVAVHGLGAIENAAGGDLADRVVVRKHQLGVGVSGLVDLIVTKGAEGVTLIRTLEVVQRAEVICVRGAAVGAEVARGRVDGLRPCGRAETARIAGRRTAAGEGRLTRFRQRTGREIAFRLQHRVDLTVGGVGGDVALAVRRVGADHGGHFIAAAAGHAVLRKCEAAVLHDRADRAVVVVLVDVVLGVEGDPFEVLLHHEVHNARDGVGAVHGRSAARFDFNAIHHGARDEVQVGAGRTRLTGHQATAVDQHQGARAAEAAEVDGRAAGCAVRDRRALSRERLRQGVDDVFNAGRALRLDVRRRQHRNRADRGQVGLRDARAGDDHGRHVVGARVSGLRRHRGHETSQRERRCDQGGGTGQSRGQTADAARGLGCVLERHVAITLQIKANRSPTPGDGFQP